MVRLFREVLLARFSLALSILLGLLASAAAEEEVSEEAAFLEKARQRVLDHPGRGLKSFSVRVTIRHTADPDLNRYKHVAEFSYAWTAPDTEDYSFVHPDATKELQRGIRQATGKMWRELTGVLFFPDLASAGKRKLETGEDRTVLTGALEKIGGFRAAFDAETLLMRGIEFPKLKVRITYAFSAVQDRHRVDAREVFHKGKVVMRTRYAAFRKVNGFLLPTVISVKAEKKATSFDLAYLTVNERQAVVEAMDEQEVREKVKAFEKGWRTWSEAEKIKEMKGLAEIPHDRVSATIARWGLRDRSEAVRVEAARVLGMMKRKNVTPLLIAAMGREEKNIRVYLAVIKTLGELDDPRAVKPLSTDWWNQRIGEYAVAAAKAKIDALGNIRFHASVDALIDVFYLTRDNTISQFKGNIRAALVKLTGQDFIYDRKKWKDWWRKNRSRFRFE